MTKQLKKLGVHVPEILLPAGGVDLTKWAVIACDQYTSQPEYWENVNRAVGDSPSTLRLIFPEIYLKDDDAGKRIAAINQTMEQYLDQGILESQGQCFILTDRSTPCTPSRKGLILALDLECYDYMQGAQTLIRATEGTVLDRIPPRVKIRENAPIELPHIMVLIDDPCRTVIEALYSNAEAGRYKKLYDFDLMQDGGHIKGWKINDDESISMIAEALSKLASVGDGSHLFNESNSFSGDGSHLSNFLFAVGDGNHSLASAKAHWEKVKADLTEKQSDKNAVPEHPARYALVEIVNVHDEGLVFEPIHRVLFNIDPNTIAEKFKAACKSPLCADISLCGTEEKMQELMAGTVSGENRVHRIPFILEGKYGILTVENPASNIEVGTLQGILDELLRNDTDIEIDYIHGAEVVTELGSKPGAMGFYLPVMDKRSLFPTVKLDGVLPRKTFSMGEAEEKRYYLECRRIL